MKYRILIGIAAVLTLAVGGVYALSGFEGGGGLGLAEFRVQNLTCGSCVQNVRNALDGVRGVGGVEVNVTSGRAKVEYDPARIEAAAIAGRISEAGYPAEPAYRLTPEEYRDLREDESRLAATFVARIGERLLPREEFEKKLKRLSAESGAPDGRPALYRAVWQQVLPKELALSAAEENGVVVQPGEVDLKLQSLKAETEGFDALVAARFGGEEAFRQALKEDLIINRNIEDHVLKDELDGTLRQVKLDRWYKELVRTVPVVIFDPALKAAVSRTGGGCGGTCCG